MLAVMATLTLLAVPIYKGINYVPSTSTIIDEMVLTQYEAIKSDEYQTYYNDDENFEVTFTNRGTVLKAETIYLEKGKIVVSLGTGRIYEKEE